VIFDGLPIRRDSNLWFRNIILKARQRGFSTLIPLAMLDTCLFNRISMLKRPKKVIVFLQRIVNVLA
jgi:hypothetical protein